MAYVYVYRSGDGNVFKIGRATDLEKRLKTHTTGNPEPLTKFAVIETDYASQCETYLHHRLRSKRSTRSDATEFFEVDPDELAALVDDARHYAEEVLPMLAEAERLSETECDGRLLAATDDVLATYRSLVGVRERFDTLGYEKDRLEAELKLAMGSASGIDRIVTWKSTVAHRFDSEAFKAAQPALYDAYVRESHSRRFVLL